MKSHNTLRSTRIFAALAVLACTFGTGLATAAPPPYSVVPTKVVRFADLDLANAKDVAILYRRIAWAAHLVCMDDAFVSDAANARSMRLCVAAATEQAIGDINRPALTALHHSKATRVPG